MGMQMKTIIKGLLTIIFSFYITTASIAATTEEVKQNIITQAKAMGVEPAVVLSIAKTESGFNQKAISPGGHIGVFQLSPATAKSMGYNPYNLDENIKAGVTYYKKMYDTFGSRELAIAAYNAGPYAIKKANNTIPHKNQIYVAKIMKNYNTFKDIEY